MIKKFFKLKLLLLTFALLSITVIFSSPLSSFSPRVEAEEQPVSTVAPTPTPTPPIEDSEAVPTIEGKPVTETVEKTQSFSTDLLQNGSFELGPDPGIFLPLKPGDTSINNWTVISSSVPGGGGGGIDYYGTGWRSSDGSRSLDLNGTPGVGGIFQDFTTTPGLKYVVSFDMAGHPSGLLQKMKVSAIGLGNSTDFPTQEAEFFFQSGTDQNNLGWQRRTWEFTARTSKTRLQFESLQTFYRYGGPALDNVNVTALEPQCVLPNFGDSNGNPLRQNDQKWGSSAYGGRDYKKKDGTKAFLPFIWYGNNKDTIGAWGCKLTSAAMIINYYAKEQGKSFRTDPEKLNAWLQKNEGYYSGKSPLPSKEDPKYWDTAFVDLASVVKYANLNGVQLSWNGVLQPNPKTKTTPAESIDSFIARTRQTINDSLCALNPVILGVNNSGHFIDATGKEIEEGVETWRIHDPLWNGLSSGIKTLKQAYSNRYSQIDLFSGDKPKRHLTVVKYSPIEMYITDSQGHKTGFDVIKDMFYEEIPSSSYGQEFLGADDDGGGLLEMSMLDIVEPESGSYLLTVIGTDTGEYGLEIRSVDDASNVTNVVLAGKAIPGVSETYEIQYSLNPQENLIVIKKVTIDIKPSNNENTINLKSNGVIPVAIISTDTFDVTKVDPLSIQFGDGQAKETHDKGHFEDINGDGKTDLMLHFATNESGIKSGDNQACLVGKTLDGINIEGCDAISTKTSD